MTYRVFFAICFCFHLLPGWPARATTATQRAAQARLDPQLVGQWLANMPGSPVRIVLSIDAGGRCGIDNDVGSCQAQGGALLMRLSDAQYRYSYKIEGNRLTVSGGDLAQPLVFRRTGGGAAAGAQEPERPEPAGAQPAASQPSPPAAASGAGGRQVPPGSGPRFTQEQWGLSFPVPAAWKVADRQEALLLGSDSEAGLMLVRFLRGTSEQALLQDYAKGLEEEGLRLMPTSRAQPFAAGSYKGLAGELAGRARDGAQLRARVVAVMTPYGDAAMVLGLTTEEKYTQLKPRVEALAGGFSFTRPKEPPVNQAIAGQYMYFYSSSTGGSYSRQDVLNLCANGTFSRGGETYSSGSGGIAAGQRGSSGRWSAQGGANEGTLLLTYNNGRTEQRRYQKSGLDLVLNGEKYGRYGDGSCSARSPF